tara:strand:- start:2123 stop:3076 length:954 start_codon:yes stop_codon:yes gene_type:complete
MTLPIYLIKKFLISLVISTLVSYSFFFIFSLIGNLGEKLPFKSILYLSALNSFQIFTYIPSHLFILSFCLFIISLKSKNELIIIKEYIELKKLFLIIFPILTLFIFIEFRKNDFLENIEIYKTNLIEPKHKDITKIFISTTENKKEFSIFNQNGNKAIVDQYLNFEIRNNTIYRGEISANLAISNNNLVSNESTIYENNNFRYENIKKILVKNFKVFWSENPRLIINDKVNGYSSNYNIIKKIIFFSLFYICISMVFFSKKLVNRNTNMSKIILLVISIFLYFLLIPKIKLNNFEYIFQMISIMIFVLIFFQTKQDE